MKELSIQGMAVSASVIETIVSIASKEVDGVASVGPSNPGGFFGLLSAGNATSGVEIAVDDDDKLRIALRIEAFYGYPLPQLAADLRTAVADALAMQMGLEVSSIDIYIDAIQFKKTK